GELPENHHRDASPQRHAPAAARPRPRTGGPRRMTTSQGTVTMGDVARLAGVSKMTVSHVINNRAGGPEPVRRRVMEVVRESGYRLNVSARTLRSGRTGVLGLAVPHVNSSYFGLLAEHVIDEAARRGFHVAIEQTGAAAEGEFEAIAQSH